MLLLLVSVWQKEGHILNQHSLCGHPDNPTLRLTQENATAIYFNVAKVHQCLWWK